MTRVFRSAKLKTGEIVCDIDDERHCGRVEGIRQGAFVTVKWEETGWLTELPIEQVRRIEKG